MRASSELTINAGAMAAMTAAQTPPVSPAMRRPSAAVIGIAAVPGEHRDDPEDRRARRDHRDDALQQIEQRWGTVVPDNGEHRAERTLDSERRERLVAPERLVSDQEQSSRAIRPP